MDSLATYMENYMIRGQHTADRSCTRYRSDVAKMVENNEISTGPGRYRLGVPNAYGNAVFVSTPTIRMQKWGASHDMSSTKTDVESDLRNLARPSVRTVCGQYTPEQGASRTLTAMPEEEFPRTYERLNDPPCTLRGTGWNRWEWLCQNPQENTMIPFEHGVDSVLMQKDDYYRKLTLPLDRSEAAADHRFICSNLFVDPAVPVARPQVERHFSDVVSEPAHEPPREPILRGAQTPYAVPTAPPNRYEDIRREQGILMAPTPFAAFIAPH